MNVLTFQLPPPQHYFGLFYSVSFLVALMILLYEGYKRNYPILPWILILTFSRILFVIGSKVFALSADEWRVMFENLAVVPASKKVLFGGLLLGGAGLMIGKWWLKFKPNFWDAFAVVLPLALAIQRVGCFFNGCCFGKPSSLPWAVQYPPYTLPHFFHHQEVLIGNEEFFSLPVHPVQLYELAGCLLAVALVLSFRRRWKAGGSSFLFSFVLLLLVRLVTEFFRDPLAHTNGGTMIGMLNQTQWVIVVLLPLFVLLLAWREARSGRVPAAVGDIALPSLASILSLFFFSTLLIWSFAGWFQTMELVALLTVFGLAAFFTVQYIFRNYRLVRYRLLYTSLLIVPFLLMSQTLPENSTDSVRIKRSKSIGVGFATGDYHNSATLRSGSGCDVVSNTTYFKQKYTLAGAGLNFRNENLTLREETNYGMNVYAGNYVETNLSDSVKSDKTLLGINPYLKFDSRWFGFGGGLHLGNVGYSLDNPKDDGTGVPGSGRKMTAFYPQIYLRFGPREWVFVDYHLADHFPSALPGYRNQLGIGTGFGSRSGINLRLGTTFSGAYASAYLPLKNGLIVEPLLNWSKLELLDNPDIDNKTNFQFSLGLRYEFGQKIQTLPMSGKYQREGNW